MVLAEVVEENWFLVVLVVRLIGGEKIKKCRRSKLNRSLIVCFKDWSYRSKSGLITCG